MDLKIAAIAIANQSTLLTRNIKDFSQISNLSIEDWTQTWKPSPDFPDTED
jgi:tRNA(fMet)-specific endonuclease VapC